MWPRDRSARRVPIPYVGAVQRAGGTPTVLSAFDLAPGEQIPQGLDVATGLDPDGVTLPQSTIGLVLPGGGDVDPQLYGQKPHPRTYNISSRRDTFERTLLEQALRRDLPVLAICRGMQLLNVHLGGTLDQHIADSPGRLEHDRDRPRAEAAHDLLIKEQSRFEELFEGPRVSVNSHHHQGLDALGDPLEVTGWADDGVIEAVVSVNHSWVVGVQWHPEAMVPVDPLQLGLFERFVEATATYEHGLEPAGR